MREFSRVLGGAFPFTLAGDLLFWTSLILAVFYPVLLAPAALGFLALWRSLAVLRTSAEAGDRDLPSWWFVPCAVLPVTCMAALNKGLWSGPGFSSPRVFRAGAAILLAVLIAASAGSALDRYLERNLFGYMERRAGDYLNETTLKAASTYGVVRALNGIVSLLQNSEVSVGIGVQGYVAVGEVLDPVNDLLERFSLVMMVSTASLGIQRVVMEFGSWLGFRLFLSLSLACLLAALWLPEGPSRVFALAGRRLLVFAVVARIVIPAAAVSSSEVFDRFLEERYSKSSAAFFQAHEKVRRERLGPGGDANKEQGEEAGDPGWYLKQGINLGDWNVVPRVKEMVGALEDVAQHVVNLIVVFVVQTILLPLVTLWGLAKLFGVVTDGRYPGLPVRRKG
jgi:hypothetical protein